MGENKRAIEIKKEKLKIELQKDKSLQNKNKIKRLQESIKRHKKIGKSISKKRRKKHGRKRI